MPREHEGAEVEFRRDLSLMDATMIGVGAMTGASIFILAGTIVGITGSSAILVILMNCLVTFLTAMCYSELAAAFPEAGGGYLWVKESMPEPFGFISGWISWFGHIIACAFYTVVFASAIVWFMEAYNIAPDLVSSEFFFKLMALLVLIIFTIINYLGTSIIGKAETGITVFQLIVIAIFVIAGIYAMVTNPAAGRFSPFSKGLNPFLTAMAFLFIAFEGYEIIAQSAEEIKEPEKNLPRAIFLSIIIVTIIYMLFLGVAIGAMGVGWLSSGGTTGDQHYVIIEAAGHLIGNYGEGMLLIGLLVGTTATLNATVYSSSRVSFAMGRDGTFPAFFGKLHPKRKTPAHSILVSSIIIAIIAVALPINDIVAAADVMFLILFVLVNAAVIILRYTRPDLDRTYKVPWFPLVPVIALILKGVLAVYIYDISPIAWYITILWITVGATIHYFAGGKKGIEESKDFRALFPSIPREIDKAKYSVSVAVPPEGDVTEMIHVGSIFARRHKGPFFLLSVIEVPRSIPLRSVSYGETEAVIKRLEEMKKLSKDRYDSPSDIFVTISHEIPGAIVDFAKEKDVNLMILGWRGALKSSLSMGTNLPTVVRRLETDVMIFKAGKREKYRKITIFARMGSDMRFAVRTARVLAREFMSEITIMYVVSDIRKMDMAREMFRNSRDRDMFEGLGLKVVDDYVSIGEVHEKLKDIDTDLVVMNYDDAGELASHLSRVKEERMMMEADYSVIFVKQFNIEEQKGDYESLSMMKHT